MSKDDENKVGQKVMVVRGELLSLQEMPRHLTSDTH